MQLSQIIQTLEQIAPPALAEEWDNVGLLVGDATQSLTRGLITIDYTKQVAEEARHSGCDLVIAYHPPIFKAIKRLTAPSVVFDAARRGVAIYSPHTALDVAEGGTNDMLADAIGLVERRPLRLIQSKSAQYKLVTFVPEKDLEGVSAALFDAGAGRIGNYSHCSFRSPGTGTFFGEAGTQPAAGESGRLERVEEIRLESILPADRAAAVIAALRRSHPYEEPAFDLLQLAAPPVEIGQGRVGTMPPTERQEILARIKRELQINHLLVAGPTSGAITRAAACPGACGELVGDALAAKAELYLTGELRHHDAVEAAAAGMTVVCTLHSNSERAVLKRLAKKLTERLPGFPLELSRMDRDPFAMM